MVLTPFSAATTNTSTKSPLNASNVDAAVGAGDAAVVDYFSLLDDSLLRVVVNLAGPLLCGLVCRRWRSVPIDFLKLKSTSHDTVPLIDVAPPLSSALLRSATIRRPLEPRRNLPPQHETAAVAVATAADDDNVSGSAASAADDSEATTQQDGAAVSDDSSVDKAARTGGMPINVISPHLQPVLSRVRALEISRSAWPLHALDAVLLMAPNLERLYLKSHRYVVVPALHVV